ncbi:MAG: endolytic transglycosylase MltG [Chitinophagaceae bacterium]
MKKILLIVLIIVVVMAGVGAWLLFGPATSFNDDKKTIYISTNTATKKAVLDSLQKNEIVSNPGIFEMVASKMNYWNNIEPGKYEVKKGSSILNIVRMLRNGQQTPVNLVITKIRTKEDLAKLVGNRFECDSTQMINYLNSNDSLKKHDINSETSMALVLPDTYTYFWNTTPEKIYKKLADASLKFWTNERKAKADSLHLMPVQVYIMASIVEEETNAQNEKGNIASVYINRINKGMPLQADPTVKFALKDFGLKRIYEKHLFTESPYNTYRNKGLPPGPICTPSKNTINAVLDAPKTDYLYFVASPDFNGTHEFSSTYSEHLQKAKQYQQALNQQQSIRNNNTK